MSTILFIILIVLNTDCLVFAVLKYHQAAVLLPLESTDLVETTRRQRSTVSKLHLLTYWIAFLTATLLGLILLYALL